MYTVNGNKPLFHSINRSAFFEGGGEAGGGNMDVGGAYLPDFCKRICVHLTYVLHCKRFKRTLSTNDDGRLRKILKKKVCRSVTR